MKETDIATDTDPETARVHMEMLRRAGPARRLQLALSLSADVITLARAGLRRAHPELSDRDVDLRFVELNYGAELATDLRRFLESR